MNEKDDTLAIDLCRLEEECIRNPILMREWADKLANARRTAARSDAALKLVKAEMGIKIRQRPSAYGIDKQTVDSVNDAIITHKDYKHALEVSIQAQYDVEVLESMTKALYDRGKQLSNACALHGQQYWSKPHADPETRQAISQSEQEEVTKKVNRVVEARKRQS